MNFWKKALSALVAVAVTAVAAQAITTLTVDRMIVAGTTVPVVSACGTGALATGSTDTAGEVTMTGATGCTLTFGTAFASAPTCVTTQETINTAATTTTVTATALVIAAAASGNKFSYICVGKLGG
jgi:hypothetical protein